MNHAKTGNRTTSAAHPVINICCCLATVVKACHHRQTHVPSFEMCDRGSSVPRLCKAKIPPCGTLILKQLQLNFIIRMVPIQSIRKLMIGQWFGSGLMVKHWLRFWGGLCELRSTSWLCPERRRPPWLCGPSLHLPGTAWASRASGSCPAHKGWGFLWADSAP